MASSPRPAAKARGGEGLDPQNLYEQRYKPSLGFENTGIVFRITLKIKDRSITSCA